MLKGKSVLVVEDNATVRRFIVSVVKNQLNCDNVMQAASADEAMKTLAGSKHKKLNMSIILSDWEMPGMSGDDFLLAIRSDPETAEIPFLMVTARNDRDSIIMAAQAGVSEYLIKPFSATTLIQKIHRVMGMQERRAMARFKTMSEDTVEVKFNPNAAYTGALINLSQTGVLMRTPVFKHGPVAIYDIVELVIKTGEQAISVKGDGVWLVADMDPNLRPGFLRAAFPFHVVSNDSGALIKSTIERLALISTPEPETPSSVPAIEENPLLKMARAASAPEPKRKRLDMDM